MIETAISRTVIDVNRDPSGAPLYPGQATTGLCPLTTFDGKPLYRSGAAPDAEEIEERRGRFFLPYHAAIAGEIARLRRTHDTVVLYDAHAIRSHVPALFEGESPVFNIGTNGGKKRVGTERRGAGDLHRRRRADRRQWPLQGRLHHPALRAARQRRPCPPDGTGLSRLPEGAGRAARLQLAAGLLDPALAAKAQATLKRVLGACLTFAEEPS